MKAKLMPAVGLSLPLVVVTLWAGGAAAQPLPAGSVYTPVAPCRIIDTRLPTPNRLVAGVLRTFHVVGSTNNFTAQGGAAAGCGIPGYDAAGPRVGAVLFNIVAVSPLGAGNLRAWPTAQAVPNASVVNYTTGVNIANGIAVAVSQDVTEGADLSIRADTSDVHVVVDVVGYFARPYEVSNRRYVVEAGPAQVGRVQPLDVAIMDQLCRDNDGCEITLQMVNWDPAQPGNVASRTERLFVSQSTRWWRFSNNDLSGLDGNGALQEWAVFDCFFTDAETYTGTPNGRADPTTAFALLNVAGGSYSDALVTCRIVIED